jgi:hypothetical protein
LVVGVPVGLTGAPVGLRVDDVPGIGRVTVLPGVFVGAPTAGAAPAVGVVEVTAVDAASAALPVAAPGVSLEVGVVAALPVGARLTGALRLALSSSASTSASGSTSSMRS